MLLQLGPEVGFERMCLGTGPHISAGTAGEAALDADQSRGGDGGEPVGAHYCI